MSFDDRLVHRLAIERATAGAEDDHGNPAQTWTKLAEVRGLVNVRDAREVALNSQAGVVASTHTIFLRPTDVRARDRIRFEPDDGRRYELTGVRDPAPMGHHLECDAVLVGTVS